MKALLIVDVQNDFCPGGALAVSKGDRVVPVINRLMEQVSLVAATKDWHPKETVHFEKWPVHCVQDSHGAEFHPGLKVEGIEQVFYKGTENLDDGYSAFEATNMDLAQFLKANKVDELYVTGLATDYCVRASALDAVNEGFTTFLVTDAIAGVGLNPGDIPNALKDMEQAGVRLITAEEMPVKN